MSLKLRSQNILSTPLTWNEMDDNLQYLSSNLSGSNINILGLTNIEGNVNITGSLLISSTLDINNTSSVNHLNPKLDAVYDLGKSNTRWNNTYIKNIISTNITASSISGSITNAITASYVQNAISSSYSTSALGIIGGSASYIPYWLNSTNLTSSIIQQLLGDTIKINGSIKTGTLSNVGVNTYSHAEGGGTNALGLISHAEGQQTFAYATGSHTEGHNTNASGTYSHAEGYNTTASGDYSHVEGLSNVSIGLYSHAEGYNTISSGTYSHSEGESNINNGIGSHAEGYNNLINLGSNYSHAEGAYNISNDLYSHVEGWHTIAGGGEANHAEGYFTTASGDYCHAEGANTYAKGNATHAEGLGTISAGNYQHAGGRYNVEDSSNQTLFIIGNGTGAGARSDAFKIRMSGSIIIQTGSAAPTWTGQEGEIKPCKVGGSYFIYCYIGGAWRSSSLA